MNVKNASELLLSETEKYWISFYPLWRVSKFPAAAATDQKESLYTGETVAQ